MNNKYPYCEQFGFDQEAIDRVRAQVLSVIASDAKDPNSIASAVFNAGAFGDHPASVSAARL